MIFFWYPFWGAIILSGTQKNTTFTILYHSWFSFHAFSSHFKALHWCSSVALDLMVSFQTRCTGWSLQQNVMFRGMWPMHLTVGDFERAFTVWLHGFRFGGVGLDFIEYILYILYYIYFILHTFMKSCDPVQHGIVFTCAWIPSMNTATWHSESFWSTSNLVIVGARSRSSSSSYHFSTFLIWGNYVRYFPG